MSTATIAVRRNQNLSRQKAQLKLGPVSASILTIALVSLLALLYLNQITKTSVFGYQKTDLETQRNKIVAVKEELQVEAARLQSVQQVQSSPVVAKMVPEGAVTYAKK
jgi:hypothetical protein